MLKIKMLHIFIRAKWLQRLYKCFDDCIHIIGFLMKIFQKFLNLMEYLGQCTRDSDLFFKYTAVQVWTTVTTHSESVATHSESKQLLLFALAGQYDRPVM